MVVFILLLILQSIVECPTILMDTMTKLLQMREEYVSRVDVIYRSLNIQTYSHMRDKDIHWFHPDDEEGIVECLEKLLQQG